MKVYLVIKESVVNRSQWINHLPSYSFSSMEDAKKERDRIYLDDKECSYIHAVEVIE